MKILSRVYADLTNNRWRKDEREAYHVRKGREMYITGLRVSRAIHYWILLFRLHLRHFEENLRTCFKRGSLSLSKNRRERRGPSRMKMPSGDR